MNETTIGFPDFRPKTLQTLEPMLAAARSILRIGHGMTKVEVSELLPDLAKQITQSVANSMESVLLLVANGCGVDALRIARTMFEAAVVVCYLDRHAELVEDFVDYLWVIRKKHHDYRASLPADKAPPLHSEKIIEIEDNYDRVKHRFMNNKRDRVRNSWCKATLREMATEVGAESVYGGLYPFGSSMVHTNILAVVAGAGQSNDLEPVPAELNLPFALQTAVMSHAMMLEAYDKIANLGRGDALKTAFNEFEAAARLSLNVDG